MGGKAAGKLSGRFFFYEGGGCLWQRNPENTAAAGCAFDGDGPAMRGTDGLDDGKPEAGPNLPAIGGDAKETVENARSIFGRDSDSGIADAEYGLLVHRFDGCGNPPAGWRIFDRIVQKIDQNLFQPVPVTSRCRMCTAWSIDGDAFIDGHQAHLIDGFGSQIVKIDRQMGAFR